MKMDVEIPVLSGFLNVPTQSGFSLNRISKKKSTQRYCLLFKSSKHGIERLEICESKDDKNPKIITLENCVKITQETAPSNQIQIVKMTGTLTLNTLTEEELREWVTALQSVAFRDKSGNNNNNSGINSRNSAIEEDNDLYCSSYGDGLFIVKLIPSETSQRCQMEAKNYMLHLTATELQLKSAEDLSIIIAKWPYRFIRKYGYRDGKFTFEAGRKCSTGEGVFQLDHTNPQEVFRCMSSKMKSMKKLISGESINSLDCGENQLTAAAQMEPGSRSPLPPSPNHHQSVSDFENSFSSSSQNHSSISIRGFLSSNDSLNNVSINSNTSSIIQQPPLLPLPQKIIPNKPPRKLIPIPIVSQTINAPPNTPIATPTSNPTSPTNEKLLLQHSIVAQIISQSNSQQNSIGSLTNIIPTTTTTPTTTATTTTAITSQTTDTSSLSQNCDNKFRKFKNFEPVAITNDQTSNSTVILNSPSPELKNRTPSPQITNTGNGNIINQQQQQQQQQIAQNDSNSNLDKPPDLPMRNDCIKKHRLEQNYECIENITDAWKTRGMNDIKHIEHVTAIPEDDLIDVVWQRTQSQREPHRIKKELTTLKNSNQLNKTTIIKHHNTQNTNSNRIQINASITDLDLENNYDRLDFLSPNHKNTSSGYKTIVTVTTGGSNNSNSNNNNSNNINSISNSSNISKNISINNNNNNNNNNKCNNNNNNQNSNNSNNSSHFNKKDSNSSQSPNDYEFIATSPIDIQSTRLVDDSYLGHGVLRKPSTPGPQVPSSAQKNISDSLDSDDINNLHLGHKNYNGMSYAIVSKPKRV